MQRRWPAGHEQAVCGHSSGHGRGGWPRDNGSAASCVALGKATPAPLHQCDLSSPSIDARSSLGLPVGNTHRTGRQGGSRRCGTTQPPQGWRGSGLQTCSGSGTPQQMSAAACTTQEPRAAGRCTAHMTSVPHRRQPCPGTLLKHKQPGSCHARPAGGQYVTSRPSGYFAPPGCNARLLFFYQFCPSCSPAVARISGARKPAAPSMAQRQWITCRASSRRSSSIGELLEAMTGALGRMAAGRQGGALTAADTQCTSCWHVPVANSTNHKLN